MFGTSSSRTSNCLSGVKIAARIVGISVSFYQHVRGAVWDMMAGTMRAVNQPESWWGWHGWDQPQPMSIVEIMQSGTLPPRLAAAFWLGLERGASIILAADPP